MFEKRTHCVIQKNVSDTLLLGYESILAHAVKDVIGEICLADAGVLISYIHNNLNENIEDLVNSSTELFFRDGTLRYGQYADVTFDWRKPPSIVLDMEFQHAPLTVFFKLWFQGDYVGVEIHRMLLDSSADVDTMSSHCLTDALARARLPALAAPAGA